MKIVFIHQNFPAQFGHLASRLSQDYGHKCWFVSQQRRGGGGPIERIGYKAIGGARHQTHYCSRTFENAIAHSHGVYEALKPHREIRPDLIVAHSGFGSSLFLRELFDCPIINYFEYFYHAKESDLDFRPEFPVSELDRLRARARNAMILLDLHNCSSGYSPTGWQRSIFPAEYRGKIRVIHDGIDTELYKHGGDARKRLGKLGIPSDRKIVTYVSRTFESMRGFDIFMRVARRIAASKPDVVFLVVGGDKGGYGGDAKHIKEKNFREHVLSQGEFPLSQMRFLGRVKPEVLATVLAASDLHLYFPVPFVLSWSLLDAMGCGCPVVASDTAPVREVIAHGETGLLAGFYAIDELAQRALELLEDPQRGRELGEAARRHIVENYSLEVCLPRLESYFRELGG